MVSKRKILIASIGFIFHAGLFVILPLALLYFIQRNNTMLEMLDLLKRMANIDLSGIPISIAVAGAIMTIASLIADLTESWSSVNLAATITSSLLQLFLFLLLIGFGDIGSIGYVARATSIEQTGIRFILDFKFFALAMITVVVMEIVVSVFRYIISRRERTLQAGTKTNANSSTTRP